MQAETTIGSPPSGRRFTASSWTVLGLAILLVAPFGVFVLSHVTSPSDGARFLFGAATLRPNGVEVEPLEERPEGVRAGDVVVAIDGRPLESWITDLSSPWTVRGRWSVGQTVTYTVVRDGATVDINVTLGKYPLGEVLARSWGTVLVVFLFTLVSSFVFFKRPGEPAARVFLVLSAAAMSSAAWTLGMEPIDLTRGFEFWLFVVANAAGYALVWATLVHFWLVFPSAAGLVQSRPWLIPALYAVPYASSFAFGAAMWPGAENIIDWLERSDFAHQLTPIVYMIGSLAAMAWRYRTSQDPEGRRQVRWVVLAFGVSITLVVALGMLPELVLQEPLISYNAQSLLAIPVPFSMAIGILKYRLFDIEAKVNRTLVYAALSALVVVIYVLIVGASGVLFQTSDNLLISLLAVGIVAVLFQPLRERLQRLINRMIYGQRDEPYEVLSDLGRRLEATLAPEATLHAIVEEVGQALKLPYAAIALNGIDENGVAASYGRPSDETVALPLVYQGGAIGQMLLSPRGPGQPFSDTDRRLLADIARQVGVVAHGVRLTADLQRSRERLVTAREEERRRIRRDLHDGLGPVLAGMAMKLDAARGLLSIDPKAAGEPLGDLKAQAQSAISDIRRLVYELRPPALDELGLIPAIREYASRLNGAGVKDGGNARANALAVSIEPPKEMPPVSAAVEVAAYRIVMEALTNVARHAKAANCAVRVSNGEGDILELGIMDDGIGFTADRRAGVGISSMRERAEELGGTFVIEPVAQGGTRVVARLPLGKAGPHGDPHSVS